MTRGGGRSTIAAMNDDRASRRIFPTTDRQRAVVLPFPTQESRGTRRRAGGVTTAGRKRAPGPRLPVEPDDFDVNREWDLLITRVVQAWCWRDPGSIRVVEDCLARLKPPVESDWS
jgi:hypothetical protein